MEKALEQGKRALMYQVINLDGLPASNEFDDMCIFPTVMKAASWLSYLVNSFGYHINEFQIRRVYVELV